MGAFLGLAASILLVFALEQAGSRYAWSDAVIISTLTVSCILWLAFIGWEKVVEVRLRKQGKQSLQEPMLPLRLFKDRIFCGMMLSVHHPLILSRL